MATTGLIYPTTAVNDATIGTLAWTNPGNVVASDDTYATASLGDAEISQYVMATGFGPAIAAIIPIGSTIDGVKLYSERKSVLGQNLDQSVKLVKGGTISGAEKATSAAWAAVEGTVTYGGATDKHGLTLTLADVSASNFGWVISCLGNIAISSLDSMPLEVFYTEPTNPTNPTGSTSFMGAINGAGVDRILLQGIPVDASNLAVGTTTAASCVVAMTADATSPYYVSSIVWSYSNTPGATGRITATDGAGNTVFDMNVAVSGPGQRQFRVPMRLEAGTNDSQVVLAAGAAGVTGKVHVTAWKMG